MAELERWLEERIAEAHSSMTHSSWIGELTRACERIRHMPRNVQADLRRLVEIPLPVEPVVVAEVEDCE